MAKILLLYPSMKLLGFRFPYSLLPLAAVLLQNKHDVRILDSQVEDYKSIDPKGYDLVGISTLSGPQITSAIEMATYIKSKAPNVPIVWGGVHPSLTARQTIQNKYVDIVCRGEGEQTLLELIDALEHGKPLASVRGLTLKDPDGNIIETPDREFINLNELPMLPYHLLNLNKYSEFRRKPSIIYMESSRGCPHRCGFCYSVAMHKRKWRCKSAERVVDEMEFLIRNYSVDEMWFTDDEFAVNKKRVTAIANEIVERGLKVRWVLSSRFDYAARYEKEFFDVIKSAGCYLLAFGGESGSQRILDLIKKDFTVDEIKKAAANLKENAMECGVNFMAGFPSENKNDIQETFSLIDELAKIDPKIHIANISIFTPFPETALYDVACQNGFKPPNSLEKWGDYRFNEVDNLPWIPLERRRLLKTISLLTRFDFVSENYRGAGILENKKLLRVAHRILWKFANIRWKHKFFSVPIEWGIVDLGLKILKFGEK